MSPSRATWVLALVGSCVSTAGLFGFAPKMLSTQMLAAKPDVPGGGTFSRLYPVGLGRYNGDPAVFLAVTPRLIDPKAEVMPVPISEGAYKLVDDAMRREPLPRVRLLAACLQLVNRDGDIYDSLPWGWASGGAKRRAYARFQGVDLPEHIAFRSAYDVLWEVITRDCKAKLLELMIEEEEATPNSVTLGGAAFLEKMPDQVCILGEMVPRPFSGGRTAVIDCATDEAIGLALAFQQPLLVPRRLWEAASTRASGFVMADGRMRLGVDVTASKEVNALGGRRRPSAEKAALPSPERISVRQFLSMSPADKRFILRAAGVKPPRRRVLDAAGAAGAAALLDGLLLPLMDEAVRRAVMIRRAVEREDYVLAASLSEDKSEKHVLSEQLAAALTEENFKLAAQLRERLSWLQASRADSTQDEGSYQRDLDADEWYMKARSQAMKDM